MINFIYNEGTAFNFSQNDLPQTCIFRRLGQFYYL